MKKYYIIIPAITLIVALVGNIITSNGMDWYNTISLPSWTPAGSIIGFVWATIFILSTISAIIVWGRVQQKQRVIIYSVFGINAVLNIFWSVLFFRLHFIQLAIWEAALLGLTVYILIVLIWKHSKQAAYLLVPYAVWVSFATYLTYSVWLLNR